MLLSTELIVPADSADEGLAPVTNWEVAETRGLVHDERLVSLSSDLRNDSHPELSPKGMSGFPLGDVAAVEDACITCI
jgi:hypothetical protein